MDTPVWAIKISLIDRNLKYVHMGKQSMRPPRVLHATLLSAPSPSSLFPSLSRFLLILVLPHLPCHPHNSIHHSPLANTHKSRPHSAPPYSPIHTWMSVFKWGSDQEGGFREWGKKYSRYSLCITPCHGHKSPKTLGIYPKHSSLKCSLLYISTTKHGLDSRCTAGDLLIISALK